MIDVFRFCEHLRAEGIKFVTGVPDTLLNDFCLAIDSCWKEKNHIIAANEGNAIALAAGYYLATGDIPLVYMQNSGLGNAINPLASLVDSTVYSIPMVLLIGWRGEPGCNDRPQHKRQGEITPILLKDLEIEYRVLNTDKRMVSNAAHWAISTAQSSQKPTALLVKGGVLAQKSKAKFNPSNEQYELSREQAIRIIVEATQDNSIYVASTGRISRELNAIREEIGKPHQHYFLNVGAMGHTLSIATGIAVANSERNVICLDGDGAALMHLGSLAVAGNLPLSNLIHIVLNNGAHESVGGQSTNAFAISLNAIADASGFTTIRTHVETSLGIGQALSKLLKINRPSFLEIRIKKGIRDDLPVLQFNPIKAREIFMKTIRK